MFNLKKLSEEQKQLRRKIIKISYEMNYSHLGSCLSTVDIIEAIYKVKRKNDPFVLSNGHAGVALYAVLEKRGILTEAQIKTLNIHPDRNLATDIYVSTGSLGQGLPIAVGMAFANKRKNVYCVISDGECTEGSIWEALRISSEYNLVNLKIIINANGWGAYGKINLRKLKVRIEAFDWKIINVDGHDVNQIVKTLKKKTKNPVAIFAETTVNQLPFLRDQDAHYYVMGEADFKKASKLLT